MEVSYKKDFDTNYMIIKATPQQVSGYKMKMVCSNSIKGFNKVSIKEFNNSTSIYYDISGKISMENMYIGRKMKADDIRLYILGVQRILESAKQYMLDVDKILMDFEYVYIKQQDKMPYFSYYPGKEESFAVSLQKVFDRIIEVADHCDKETVILSYGLQQMRLGENNITINDIIKFVNEEKSKGSDNINGDGEPILDQMKIEDIVDENLYDKGAYIGETTIYGDNITKNRCLQEIISEFFQPFLKVKNTFKGINGKYKTENELENLNRLGNVNKSENLNKLGNANKSDNLSKLGNVNKSENLNKLESIDEKETVEQDRLDSEWLSEVEDSFNFESVCREQTEYGVDDGDATTLLRSGTLLSGIVLKCSDIERPQTIIPNDYPCIIGKSTKSADYIIDDKTVSRVHLRIHQQEGEFFVEDLNSTNGTFLNDEKLKPHQLIKLNIGDKVKLSELEYIVC